MFSFDEELGAYAAELNGVEFVCDEPQDSYEEEARKLSKLYAEKLPEIIAFMLPGLQQFFGKVDPDELPRLLGKPTIDLGTFQMMYMEQTLDDTHIIELEYGDDFEEFSCFNIDG